RVWTDAELREQEAEMLVQPGLHVEALVPANGDGTRLVHLRVRTPEGVVPSDVVALRPVQLPEIATALPATEAPGPADEALAIPVPATPWPIATTLLRPADRERALRANAQR